LAENVLSNISLNDFCLVAAVRGFGQTLYTLDPEERTGQTHNNSVVSKVCS